MNFLPALFLALCAMTLGGCQYERQNTSERTKSAPPVDPLKLLTRPFLDADLELTVWHYVVSPQEIRGVICVRDVAAESVALIDRWNSIGSDQWHVVVDGQSVFSNPQHVWEANSFTESTFASNSIRTITFVLHAQPSIADKGWQFTPNEPPFHGRIDASTGVFHPDQMQAVHFAPMVTLQVVLDASGVARPPSETLSSTRLFTGQLCATSRAVEGMNDLDQHVLGSGPMPSRPLR